VGCPRSADPWHSAPLGGGPTPHAIEIGPNPALSSAHSTRAPGSESRLGPEVSDSPGRPRVHTGALMAPACSARGRSPDPRFAFKHSRRLRCGMILVPISSSRVPIKLRSCVIAAGKLDGVSTAREGAIAVKVTPCGQVRRRQSWVNATSFPQNQYHPRHRPQKCSYALSSVSCIAERKQRVAQTMRRSLHDQRTPNTALQTRPERVWYVPRVIRHRHD
jgi:hypothetical protein